MKLLSLVLPQNNNLSLKNNSSLKNESALNYAGFQILDDPSSSSEINIPEEESFEWFNESAF